MIKKLIKPLLKFLAKTARPYLKTVGLLQTSKVYNKSALVWTPGSERIVVLAPHMDDEVIGCGGTLARHVASGADVTVVFLTDGGQGGSIPTHGETPATIQGTRKLEAHQALRELAIEKVVFLDAADGNLMGEIERVSGRLRDLLEEVRPNLVYLPFFTEEHPDHRAASPLLLAAVQGGSFKFDCFGYEVWTPLFPNCLVPIDDTIEAKKRSLMHYQSQLAEADYLHTALGLNAYRSNAFFGGTCRFAEAFYALPVEDYLELYRSYRQAS